MGLSILHNLLDIRGKLFSSINLQDKALSTMSGLSEYAELFSGTIADGVGNILKIESNTTENTVTIIRTAVDGVSDSTTMFSGAMSDLRDAWDGISVPEEYRDKIGIMKNFAVDASQAQSCNEVITSLIEKYTVNVKARASDLSAIINSSNISSSDANRFINAINSASDSDGLLSNYAFLGVLRSFLDSGKSSLEEGSLTLDESSPVYLSHFLGTAFLAILSSLASFVGACLQWVNLLIGTIIAAIGWIAESVLSALSNVATTDIQVKDPMASTFWFEAPSMGSRYVWSSYPTVDSTPDRIATDEANYRDINGYGLLYWLDANDNTKLLVNEYPTVLYDVSKMRSWVNTHVKLSATISGTDFNFVLGSNVNPQDTEYFSFMDQFLLDDNDVTALLSGSNDSLADYFFDQMQLCCVMEVVRSSPNYPHSDTWHDLYSGSFNGIISSGSIINPEVDWRYHFDKIVEHLSTDGDPAALCVAFAVRYMLALRSSQSSESAYNWYQYSLWNDSSSRASGFTKLMINRKQAFDSFGILGYLTDYTLSVAGFGVFNMSHVGGLGNTRMYRHALGHLLGVDQLYNPQTQTYSSKLYYKNMNADDEDREYKLSSIPESRMFKYANADLQNVVTALVLVSTVLAVTLCVGAACAKAIKKHSWKKQYIKKREVKQAAAAYEANPTSSNLDTLYKKQKSYNFKAKLFGWDSFDASNMWFNESSSASAGSNSMDLTSIAKLIKG